LGHELSPADSATMTTPNVPICYEYVGVVSSSAMNYAHILISSVGSFIMCNRGAIFLNLYATVTGLKCFASEFLWSWSKFFF
jgi:hypothetical protein